MKFSFMSFSTPELSLSSMLSLAAELGYDGIEPRLEADHGHGISIECDQETRAEIRQTVEQSAADLSCLATSCQLCDPSKREEMIDTARRQIRLASDVGAPCIRVFGGEFPEGMTRSDAIEALSHHLSQLAKPASSNNVTVCLETHDAWCDPRDVAEVMRRVDDPSVGVNWDIMHPVRMGKADVEEAYDVLHPWIRYVHVHDGVFSDGGLEFVPMGEGKVDHRRAVELLEGGGYEGFLSGEWINWEPYETHLPRELDVLREYTSP